MIRVTSVMVTCSTVVRLKNIFSKIALLFPIVYHLNCLVQLIVIELISNIRRDFHVSMTTFENNIFAMSRPLWSHFGHGTKNTENLYN